MCDRDLTDIAREPMEKESIGYLLQSKVMPQHKYRRAKIIYPLVREARTSKSPNVLDSLCDIHLQCGKNKFKNCETNFFGMEQR